MIMKKKLNPIALVEIIFDAAYLLFAFIAGFYLLSQAQGNLIITLYGFLALTLVFGDSFHLFPRIYAQATNSMEQHYKALGFGKGMTSVTMTLFYVLLYYIWRIYFNIGSTPVLTMVIFGLAGIRILLCLMPQNGWLKKDPSFIWNIIRNIPFAILGGILIVLFALQGMGNPFEWMWLAVTLSFLFYLIVVLFADKHKALGSFMLPKTCMYIWIICMGFALL